MLKKNGKKRRPCGRDRKRQLAVLMDVFKGKCWWCKCSVRLTNLDGSNDSCKDGNRATRDHLVSTSEGGSNYIHNMVLSCQTCNNLRGSMKRENWEKLLKAEGFEVGDLSFHQPPTQKPSSLSQEIQG